MNTFVVVRVQVHVVFLYSKVNIMRIVCLALPVLQTPR